MTSGSVKICSVGSHAADLDMFFRSQQPGIYMRGIQLLSNWKSCPRKEIDHRLPISPYCADQISSLLVLLNSSSPSMSTFQNTEYMDACGSAFNMAGHDQINIVMGPNSLGAMQNHSCTNICSFSVLHDSRSQGTAKPSSQRCL